MAEDQIYRPLLKIAVDAFVGVGDAVPNKYFAVGPYRAEQVGGSWWGVVNKNGLNVLTFPEKPGAVVTDEANAKSIADEWNARTKPFEYPPDPYVEPGGITPITEDEIKTLVFNPIDKVKAMSLEPFLGGKVREAGGSIESRCTAANMQFENHYCFTKEALERFIEQIKKEVFQ